MKARRLATAAIAVVGALTFTAPAFAAPNTVINAGPSGWTNDNTPSFGFNATGVTSPPVTLQCRIDTASPASTTDWYGCTSLDPSAPLADGYHTFRVRATDGTGTDGSPAARTVRVDTVEPVTTITVSPPANTIDNTPTFRFASNESLSTFECQIQPEPSGGADAGAWVPCSSPWTPPMAVGDGDNTFYVRATDRASNTDGSAAEKTINVDTSAPDTSITAGPGITSPDPTLDSTPDVSFDADEPSTFQCRLDGIASWQACSSPLTLGPLSDGSHELEVRAVDLAGHKDPNPELLTFDVDGSVPDVTILTGPANGSFVNTNDPEFTFESSDVTAQFDCSFLPDSFAACTSPFNHPMPPLNEGLNTFRVRAFDTAGNVSAPVTRTFTVDSVAPDLAFIAPSPANAELVTTNVPEYHFEVSDPAPGTALTVVCWYDGNAAAPCTSPVTFGPLALGVHTVNVKATDQAGNETIITRTVDVDADIPETTIIGGPADGAHLTVDDVTFLVSSNEDPNVTFECRMDGSPVDWGTCHDMNYGESVWANLSDGTHTFEVRAKDANGNIDPTPASRTFSIDDSAPILSNLVGPGAGVALPGTPIKDNTPTYTFESNDPTATFLCQVDFGNPWFACTSPLTLGPLSDGQHTLTVKAIDGFGNESAPLTANIVIDTVAPNVFIMNAPDHESNNPNVQFDWVSDESPVTYQCRLVSPTYTPPFASCTSPKAYVALADGVHTFQVRAIDSVGNVGPTSVWSFKILSRCTNRVFSRWFGNDAANSRRGTNSAEYMNARGGNDSLRGSGGDDCLIGGAGEDSLQGDAGDDQIDAIDGATENDGIGPGGGISCGDGEDIVYADAADSNVISPDCEIVHTF